MIEQAKYILSNGIPITDVFTMHSSFDYYWQKPFMCLLTYFVYNFFGEFGLLIGKLLLGCIRTFTYMFFMNELTKNANYRVNNVLMVMFVTLISTMVTDFRPFMISDVLLMFMLINIERYIVTTQIKLLLWLPVISFLMVNFHSTMWFVMFLFMLPYLFETRWAISCFELIVKPHFFIEPTYRKGPLSLVGIISFLCGMLNPYGLKEYWYMFNAIIIGFEQTTSHIQELQAFSLHSLGSILVLILVLVVTIQTAQLKQIELRAVYFFIGGLLLLSMAVRNINYMLITSLFLSAFAFKNNSSTYLHDRLVKRFNVKLLIVPFIGLLFMLFVFITTNHQNVLYQMTGGDAVDYMVEHCESDSMIFNWYGVGARLELNSFKPYIDERSEAMSFPINHQYDLFNEAMTAYDSETAMQTILDRYQFEYIILPLSSDLYVIAKNIENTVILYQDDYFIVYQLI